VLARRLAGILPPLTRDEVIEASTIRSVAGLLQRHGELMSRRPFREALARKSRARGVEVV